jgi:hypothetical protein
LALGAWGLALGARLPAGLATYPELLDVALGRRWWSAGCGGRPAVVGGRLLTAAAEPDLTRLQYAAGRVLKLLIMQQVRQNCSCTHGMLFRLVWSLESASSPRLPNSAGRQAGGVGVMVLPAIDGCIGNVDIDAVRLLVRAV